MRFFFEKFLTENSADRFVQIKRPILTKAVIKVSESTVFIGLQVL